MQAILAGLKTDGHRPAVESYTLLLCTLIDKGRIAEGHLLLQEMINDKVMPDAIFFNTLLNAYCEARKMEEAQLVFTQMKDKGCTPMTSTYNTLIKGYGLIGKPEEAIKVPERKEMTSNPITKA